MRICVAKIYCKTKKQRPTFVSLNARKKIPPGHSLNDIQKRPWYQWHLSSFLPMLLPLAFIGILSVPGQHIDINWTVIESWEHGWPAIHLVQIPEGMTGIELKADEITWAKPRTNRYPDMRFWSAPEGWNYSTNNSSRQWSQLGLIVNLTVTFFVCVSIGATFEIRRRHRRSLFQVTIADILILTALLAIPLGYWQYESQKASRQKLMFEGLKERENAACFTSTRPPVWLDRLMDYRHPAISYSTRILRQQGNENFITHSTVIFEAQTSPLIKDPFQSVEEIKGVACDNLQIYGYDESVERLLELAPRLKLLLIRNKSQSEVRGERILKTVCNHAHVSNLILLGWNLKEMQVSDCRLESLTELTVETKQFDQSTIDWILQQPNLEKVRVDFSPADLIAKKPHFEVRDRRNNLVWDGKQKPMPAEDESPPSN